MALGDLLTPRDALFHTPGYRDRTWLETNWWSFLVPEHNLRGHIYNGFRTNLGVVFSQVHVWSRDASSVLDFDYWDSQVHLPLPACNLDHFRLDNGLEVKMHEPLKRYSLSYDGFGDTHFRLEYEALMPAVDSRETQVAGGRDFSAFHAVDPALAANIGHIDQTLAVKGEVVIKGRSYEVDFPTNRDHTWSPRPERAHGRGYFDEGYFGEDLCFHVQTHNEQPDRASVTNGYIIDHGELLSLKAGEGRYVMDGWLTKRLEYELEDERGRTHRFVGEPTATTYLPTWPNQYNNGGVVRWTSNGDVGWGEFKWHWETSDMHDYQLAHPEEFSAAVA
ncbi:MAG: hypothetical protein QOJ57_2038 [Thermoleophilaceae bacterium]|nr:hypothetical protein [Thermoleophilaceae bacterium]